MQQARARLNFVLPGDRVVVVADGTVQAGEAPAQTPGVADDAAQPPWYEGLLESSAPPTAEEAGHGTMDG